MFEIKSPFNYAGTKQNILPFLHKNFPTDKKYIVDLFCGGGSVGVSSLDCFELVIMNDIVEPLIKFYEEIHTKDFEILKDNVLKYKIDKNNPVEYANLRTLYNQNKDNPYMFFGCCCSCTNNLMRFNKKKEFNQTFGMRSINDSTLEKLKDYSERIYGKNVVFVNKPFYEVWNIIKQYKNVTDFFFYIDPPYIQTNAGYNVYWSKEDEEKLYNMMDEMDLMGVSFSMSNTLKHKGVLNPFYDRFKKWNIIVVPKFYNKAKKKETDKESVEILVKNF